MDTELHPLAGKPAPPELLIDLHALAKAYYELAPDLNDPGEMVRFGADGHRGSSLRRTFTEAHILSITQAICDYRINGGLHGPLFLGKDTHALSGPAQRTVLEVLAGNHVETFLQPFGGATPTPVISRSILVYNRDRKRGLADGIVLTPSKNPPDEGGLKYERPTGGPPGDEAAKWIQDRANELLRDGNRAVRRVPFTAAVKSPMIRNHDFVTPYVNDLRNVIDMAAIQRAGLSIGVDPMGGASVAYWDQIAETYGLKIDIMNNHIDPRFGFMTSDRDGKIRMDCASHHATARLIQMKDRYSVAIANDPDAGGFGVVTPSVGLMRRDDYLAAAVEYLQAHRPLWPKTERTTLLRRDGGVWTGIDDGIVLGLLAAEMTARTGREPSVQYRALTATSAKSYARIDVPEEAEPLAHTWMASTAIPTNHATLGGP